MFELAFPVYILDIIQQKKIAYGFLADIQW